MKAILCAAVIAVTSSSASAQCIVSRFEHAGPIAIHGALDRTRLAILDEVPPSDGVFVYDTDTAEELLQVPNPQGEQFGDVAIDGDLLAIGHPYSDFNNMGEVHVHDHRTGDLLRILDNPPGFDDFFGQQVELFDGHFVISEPDFAAGAGSGHYYETYNGPHWSMGDPSQTYFSFFATDIAIGERAGRPITVFVGVEDYGSTWNVHIFHFVTATPIEIGPLVSPAPVSSVAIDEDLVAVGTSSGVYVYDVGTLDLVAMLPPVLSFAGRVCFSDGLLSVGTGASVGGQVVVYDQDTWAPVLTLDAPGNAAFFGRDACLAGDRLATFVEIDGVPEVRVYTVPRKGSPPWEACEWDNYCDPITPNSTGEPGGLVAVGSEAVAAEDLTLEAFDMPPGNVCLFLASVHQGFNPTPGTSCGNLCLMGPDVARFKFDTQIVDAEGRASLTIEPFVVLTNPPQPILAGQTWNFQAWHRDADALPACDNNFTGACSVTLR